MQPRHQAIAAGLALSLAFGVAAPAPVFAQTTTQQTTQDSDSEAFGNSDATVIADDTAKLPVAGEFDRADEYEAGASSVSNGIMTLSLNSLMNSRATSIRPMALSSEMKYFAQNESGSNYNLGFSSGDGYYAMGFYQFDRRYSLVDFMTACYNYNPQKYGMFKAVIDRGSELKSGTVYDRATEKLTEIGRLAEEAWHAAYAADPSEFSALQDSYGYTNYYLPVEDIVAKKGLDLSDRADCLKGLCWGLSNLFGQGGCQKFFDRAHLSNDMTDEQAVTAICDAVIDYMTDESTNQYASSYASRYKREKQTCLNYLAQHDADKADKGEGSTGGSGSGDTGDTGATGGASSGAAGATGAGADAGGSSDGDSASDNNGGSGSGSESGSTGDDASGSGAGSDAGSGSNTDAGSADGGQDGAEGSSGSDGAGGSSNSSTSGDADRADGADSGSTAGSEGASGDAGSGSASGSSSDGASGSSDADASDGGDASGADSVSGSDDGSGSKDGDGAGSGSDNGATGTSGSSDKAAKDSKSSKDVKATDSAEKLPATADASSIALAVSTMLSAVGAGAVVVGKRRAGEKVPFEDGFRG